MEPEKHTAQEMSQAPESDFSDAEKNVPAGSEFWAVGFLLAVIFFTLVCYSPVFFNFFNGDDFVHLTWLSSAIHHPELVVRNFYTSWLDGTTTRFYRPLISVFMVSDYALWGVNGLGFRLTNIIFHLSSTVFIFLIARQLLHSAQLVLPAADTSALQPDSDLSESELPEADQSYLSPAWPMAAAALFALYPLHPEAVSWITGRVDSVVTAFCLFSFFCYIRYSKTSSCLFLVLAIVADALGLLSKEMAVTLAPVFLLYELIYSRNVCAVRSVSAFFQAVFQSLWRTLPFWLVLVAYFVVRRLALGTFVGGYDDSLFFISNPGEFIKGWIHALGMLLIPVNKSLMGSHHILSKAWTAAVVCCAGAALLKAVLDERARLQLLFVTGWLAFCLLPVYKLFNIADDLQGSRLAYLATAPLCMLLAAGLLPSFKMPLLRLPLKALLAVTCILAGILLWTNNLPWQKAGQENNAIRAALAKLYQYCPGDPPVLLLGLPDQIEGAYTCRNALPGMTKKPQLNRDINNCLMVSAFEPIFPFGYLKDSIADNKDRILILWWQSADKQFRKIDVDRGGLGIVPVVWPKERLHECLSVPEQKNKPQVSSTQDGCLQVRARGKQPQFLEVDLLRRSCFTCDFVEINLDCSQAPSAEVAADLLYSNDAYPSFELRRRARAYLKPGRKNQSLLFALRGLPEWSLGGKTHRFRFVLPADLQVCISSIRLVPWNYAIPSVSFDNSGYFGSKGFIHLTSSLPPVKLNVDVSKISGASQFAVETTRTNLLFEDQNTQKRSRVEDTFRVYKRTSAELPLRWADFKSAGLYELRVFALGPDGTVCGAASDHLVISVK